MEEISKTLNTTRLHTMQLDLADSNLLKDKVHEAVSIMGSVDIFVNAAGVSAYNEDSMTIKMYDYICDINQKGLFFINKYCAILAPAISSRIANKTLITFRSTYFRFKA